MGSIPTLSAEFFVIDRNMNLVYIATRIAARVSSSPSVDSDTPTFDIKVGDRVKVKKMSRPGGSPETFQDGIWEVTKFPIEIKNSKEPWARISPVDPLLDKVCGLVLVHKDGSTVDYRPWLRKKGFAPYRTDGLEGNANKFTEENDGPHGYTWNRPVTVTLEYLMKI